MAKDIIARLKADTSNFDRGFANAGKSVDQFKQKNLTMGGIVDKCTKSMLTFAAGIASVGTAMKVVKDMFLASEQNIDNWGRTCESASALYQGFLTSVNTGDISGYLSNIETIASAARDAYDALDLLSTQKAMNKGAIANQESENERMRQMLKTGRYIAPLDGRTAVMKEGEKLTEKQLENLAKKLENGMKKVNKYVKDDIVQTTNAIESLYNEQAAILTMSKADFKAGTKDMDSFRKMLEGASLYSQYEKDHTSTVHYTSSVGGYDRAVRDGSVNPYEKYKAWTVFKDDGELFTKINDLIGERSSAERTQYAKSGQAYKAIDKGTKITGGGKSGSGGGTVVGMAMQELDSLGGTMDDMTEKAWTTATSMEKLRDELSRLTREADSTTNTEERNRLLAKASSLQNGIKNHDSQVRNAEGLAVMNPEALAKNIQDFMNENPIMIRVDVSESNLKATKMQDSWGAAADAISRVGSAMNGLNEPALNIATMLAETIATLGLTYAQTLAKDASSKSNIWTFIAAAAASTISLAATVASYKKSMNSYADGGMITGGAYAGDAVPIMANAGEVVLNAAMMSNLASNLQGGGGQQAQTYIKGEQLITVINNTRRRQGKGELL